MNAVKHILQKNGSDCGIAAVSQVLGMPYSRVRKICGPVGRGGGLEFHEILWLLNECDSRRWRMTAPRKEYTLAEWAEKHPTCVVAVGLWALSDCGHAMSCVDGRWYCPSGLPIDETRTVSAAWIPAE